MGPRFGPPKTQPAVPKPKNIKEVPAYLGKVVGGFFKRLFYIIGLVWETNPWILFAMLFFCLCDGFLPVIGAYISKDLLNAIADVLHSEEVLQAVAAGETPLSGLRDTVFATVMFMIVWYFVYQCINRLINRFSTIINNLAGELVSNHIKLQIMEKAKTVDLASFDRPDFYEKLENANREAGMRPLMILRATFNVISTVISIVSFAIILIGLHPLAPVIIAVMALPGAIINYVYRNKQFRYMRHRSKDRRQMDYYSGLVVDKDKAKELKIMGLSDTLIGKYKQVFARYFAGIRRLVLQEGVWQIVFSLFSLIAHCALFVFVAFVVVNGGGQIGDYSLYTGALNSISSYVTVLVTATASIYEGTLFIDNMMIFMREKPTVVPQTETPKKPAIHAPHTIEFRDVTFRYAGGSGRNVIDHVSLTLHPGENVVLVGLNGAGKTTLIKLLTRLYDPTEGQILLDGVDLKEYDVEALYNLFGIIFQDFGKYAVSVRENIAFGDIRVPPEDGKITEAAQKGNAADFIEKLPNGYDTELMRYFEEDGTELSIGQWQKLSIARAFYKDSDILILDEPTASLDPIAEQEIFNQFAHLGENKISVFVSHRLSSATTADKIVVMDYGRIAEIGTHAELMQKKGEYYRLFTTQAQHYVSRDGTQIADGTEEQSIPPRP